MTFQWNHHFFKLWKSPKSFFFVGEWNHHFCWPKGMTSLCVCVLAKSHESQLLKDITDTGFYHKIPWIFHEISADWIPVCWAAVYPVAHLTTPAITAENAMAMDPNKNGFTNHYEPRKNEVFTNFNTQEWLSVFATKLWISLGTIEGIQTPKWATRKNIDLQTPKVGNSPAKTLWRWSSACFSAWFFCCKNRHFCLPI